MIVFVANCCALFLIVGAWGLGLLPFGLQITYEFMAVATSIFMAIFWGSFVVYFLWDPSVKLNPNISPSVAKVLRIVLAVFMIILSAASLIFAIVFWIYPQSISG